MSRHQDPRAGAVVALGLALGFSLGGPLVPEARANGRPPATNGVVFQPTRSDSIYVRSTFGLLISRDAGATFRWVCEQAIGYGGTFDPKYAVAPDGAIYATTFTGLRVSRDGGCSFQTATAELPAGAPGRLADRWVDALDIGPTGEVWVATSDGATPNDVYRSTDGGVTFAPRGRQSADISWKSVAVARSDAQRVYLTGYQLANPGPRAHFYSTANGGEAWKASALAGVQIGGTPTLIIAAIDPANADRLFVISLGSNGALGDRLYRSLDGGTTFAEVLATSQPLTDVVLLDATTVIAVGGDGTFRSTDGGASFGAPSTSPRLGCLGKRPDGSLIGCAANWDPDFMAVGRSANAAEWEKLFRFIDLGGPLECPAGTPGADTCAAELWPGLCQQFGVQPPACGSGAEVDATPAEGGGCCDAGPGAPAGAGALAALVGWLLARRPRRAAAR